MALEGLIATSSGGSSANVWEFSLDNQKRHDENLDLLTDNIQRYMESGEKVKVDYIQVYGNWPWRSWNRYLVQSVEPVASDTTVKK